MNETAVTPELLGEVLEMPAAMKPKDRGSYEVRALCPVIMPTGRSLARLEITIDSE